MAKRTLRFKIDSDVLRTDHDFGWDSKPIVFRGSDGIRSRETHGLDVSNMYYEKYPNVLSDIPVFQIIDDVEFDCYYIPKFEVTYTYDDELPKDGNWKENARPITQLAQFICWQCMKKISGRYFDIDDYLSFFARLVNKFNEWDYTGDVKESYTFDGNASGQITVELVDVTQGENNETKN